VEIDAGHALESVSCPAGTSFCVAVDDAGNALTSTAGVWGAAAGIDPGHVVKSVSCPTASFCTAVDDAGNALTYSVGVWSAPVSIDPGHVLNSVSCSAVSFCAAVDDAGNALTDPPSQSELEEAARKTAEEAAVRKRAEEAAARAAQEEHKGGSSTGGTQGKSVARNSKRLGDCVSSAQQAFKRDKQQALRHRGKSRAKGLRSAQKKKQQSVATCKRRFG
jgi:hypothetical protein